MVARTGASERKKIEVFYVQLLVYIRVHEVYVKTILAPFIGATALGIIVATFVTVKHTELPVHIYAFFPGAGVAGTMLIFLHMYEGICLARISDGIVSQLTPTIRDTQSWTETGGVERKYVERVVRAFRPVALPIYHFGSFTMNVIFGLSKEILNQVVVLHTL